MTKYLALSLLIYSLNSCNSKNEPSNTQLKKPEQIETENQWPTPPTPIKGCKNIINQKISRSHVQWTSSPPPNKAPLNVTILWKANSPLAKITFQKIRDLNAKNSNALEISFLSEKKPNSETLTNRTYKPFYFGLDTNSKIAKMLHLETFPQVIVSTKEKNVCWQGHPSHLNSKVIQDIISALENKEQSIR